MIPTLILLPVLTTGLEPVSLKLIPSGAVQRVGSYSPVQAKLAATTEAKPAAGLTNPQYGTIVSGTKKIAFALSEVDGQEPKLVVDANGNGDLSDDAPAEWKTIKRGANTMYQGGATVDIGKDVPVRVNMYRFDPKDPQRAALKDSVLYYYDYGYEVGFKLDGKPFTTFIAGEPSEGSPLQIDRNGDKKISFYKEIAIVGQPFNFTGTTYKFTPSGTGLSLETVAAKLPKAPLPPDLSTGKKTLPIKGMDLEGKPLDLLKDYKGKLVMVDFWATWCGPCIGELPNVKAAYTAHHGEGFEILGISFDKENMAEKLKEFTAKNEMPWRQMYEGKWWETEVGKAFDVAGIPFTLLIDGDTGKIVAQGDEMRGPGLSEFIAKKLADKKAKR